MKRISTIFAAGAFAVSAIAATTICPGCVSTARRIGPGAGAGPGAGPGAGLGREDGAPIGSTPQEAPQPITRDEPKVGRNDPCPCGSGKKYKKCHGATG